MSVCPTCDVEHEIPEFPSDEEFMRPNRPLSDKTALHLAAVLLADLVDDVEGITPEDVVALVRGAWHDGYRAALAANSHAL